MFSIAKTIASGFGSGFSPKAPGTAGSLVALPIGVLLAISGQLGWGVLLCILLGWLSVVVCLRQSSSEVRAGSSEKIDPQWIVIDEWAGLWIAMLPLDSTLSGILLDLSPTLSWWQPIVAFLLFRLFDITKPGPVKRVEQLPGATGIMADDLLAGLFAALSLLLILMAVG